MMKKLLLLLILFFPTQVFGFDYILGTSTYSAPTMAEPAKGISIIESNFGTTLLRLTSAQADGIPISEGGDYRIGVEYAKSNPESLNGTYIILSPTECVWYLYYATAPYAMRNMLSPTLLGFGSSGGCGGIEPRWSTTEDNVFYFAMPGKENYTITGLPAEGQATFRKYTIGATPAQDTVTTIFDAKTIYAGAWRLWTGTEGRPSKDNKFWVWNITGDSTDPTDSFRTNKRGVIVYDLQTQTVLTQADGFPTAGSVDSIGMSPSGTYIYSYVGWPNDYCASYICAWNKSTFPASGMALSYAAGHNDWAIDVNGNDVFFGQKNGACGCGGNDCIAMWDPLTVSGGAVAGVTLQCASSGPAMHAGGPNYDTPGWGLISDYGASDGWMTNQYFLIELKESPRIWRVANSRSSNTNYNIQFGTMNRRGTKMFINTDWGSADGNWDVIQASLTPTWYADLSGGNKSAMALVSYNYGKTDISALSDRFSLLITRYENEVANVTAIKALDPTIKAFYYENVLSHGDSYIVTSNGHNCYHKTRGWYLHDISNTDYHSALAAVIHSDLTTYSQFDGVLLDDVWTGAAVASDYCESTGLSYACDSPTVDCTLSSQLTNTTNWQTNMRTLLNTLSSEVHGHTGKKVIANTSYAADEAPASYGQYLDGITDESFAQSNIYCPDTAMPGTWLNRIQKMAIWAASEKYYIAVSGVKDVDCGTITQTIKDKAAIFSYASFMLGTDGGTWNKHSFMDSYTYANAPYYGGLAWRNLGVATGTYATTGYYSYRRNFMNGIVLANPTENTDTNISLGGSYVNPKTWLRVTSITLAAREGIVLLNDPDIKGGGPPKVTTPIIIQPHR